MFNYNPSQTPTPVGLGALTGLLKLQGDTTNQMTQGIKNLGQRVNRFGQINRDEDIRNLIASGDLNQLGEQEQRNLITATAGGSLTPEMQAGVDSLLSNARALESRAHQTAQQEDRQKHSRETARTLAQRNVEHQKRRFTQDDLLQKQRLEKDREKTLLEASLKDKYLGKQAANQTAMEKLRAKDLQDLKKLDYELKSKLYKEKVKNPYNSKKAEKVGDQLYHDMTLGMSLGDKAIFDEIYKAGNLAIQKEYREYKTKSGLKKREDLGERMVYRRRKMNPQDVIKAYFKEQNIR